VVQYRCSSLKWWCAFGVPLWRRCAPCGCSPRLAYVTGAGGDARISGGRLAAPTTCRMNMTVSARSWPCGLGCPFLLNRGCRIAPLFSFSFSSSTYVVSVNVFVFRPRVLRGVVSQGGAPAAVPPGGCILCFRHDGVFPAGVAPPEMLGCVYVWWFVFRPRVVKGVVSHGGAHAAVPPGGCILCSWSRSRV
jgi:hypothetical protein